MVQIRVLVLTADIISKLIYTKINYIYNSMRTVNSEYIFISPITLHVESPTEINGYI